MTQDQLNTLNRGDLIRHKSQPDTIVVTANYGGRVTAVRTYDVTNPSEWELVMKAVHQRPLNGDGH
jgi:hypothetical protein